MQVMLEARRVVGQTESGTQEVGPGGCSSARQPKWQFVAIASAAEVQLPRLLRSSFSLRGVCGMVLLYDQMNNNTRNWKERKEQ